MNRILLIALISILFTRSFGQQWKWALDLKGASGGDVQTDATGNIYLLSAVDNSVYANTNYSLPCGECGAVIAMHDASGNVIWARGLGLWSYPSHFSMDKIGNIYIAGSYVYTNTFCGGNNPSLTNTANGNCSIAFICKYDGHGNLLWVNTWTDTNASSVATDIKTDYTGNSFVTGLSGSYPQQTASNFFLKKFNSQGNLIWSTDANWKGNMGATSIDIDNNDNCYITGMFEDTAYFQNIKFKSNSPSSIFIAKYDNSGNIVWAKKDGTNNDESHSIKLDKTSSSFYLTGMHSNPSAFGSFTLNSGALYLAKYDIDGNISWIKSAGAIQGYDIALDTANSPIITGFFQNGIAVFGSGVNTVTLSSNKDREIFAAKYDKNGNFKWAIAPGGSSGDENIGFSVACDYSGNCFLTGKVTTTTTFGSTTITVTQGILAGVTHILLTKVKDSATIITQIKKIDANNLNFEIFPNPTSEFINLSYAPKDISDNIKITIYNSVGTQVYSDVLYPLAEGIIKIQLDKEKVARGLYLIEVTSGANRAIKYIILN